MGVTNKYLKSELEKYQEALSIEMRYTKSCMHKIDMYDYLTGYDDGRGGDFKDEYIPLDVAAERLGWEKFNFVDVFKQSGVLGDKNVPRQEYLDNGMFGIIQSNFRSGDKNITVNIPVVRVDCLNEIKSLFDKCSDNLGNDYNFNISDDGCIHADCFGDGCAWMDDYVWSYEQFNR